MKHWLLVLFLSILLLPCFKASATQSSILILATDTCDYEYITAVSNAYGFKPSTAGLENFTEALRSLEWSHVILVDPNYGSSKAELAGAVAKATVDYAVSGGRVVTTFNGFMMLYPVLQQETPLRIIVYDSPLKPGVPSSYNVSKYKALLLFGEGVEEHGGIYYLHVGKGLIIVVPLNIAWAYCDTHDPYYLELLLKSLTAPPWEPGGSQVKYSIALPVIAVLASAVAVSQLSLPRTRRPQGLVVLPPARLKLEADEALAHPARREIMRALEARGAVTMSELLRLLNMPKATLSWHLYVLESRGIISSFKWRKSLFYFASGPTGVESLASRLSREDPYFCIAAKSLLEDPDPVRVSEALNLPT
ncbi:helix-turn-helix domain-containing protein, partial [Desulfurococcus mucosus]